MVALGVHERVGSGRGSASQRRSSGSTSSTDGCVVRPPPSTACPRSERGHEAPAPMVLAMNESFRAPGRVLTPRGQTDEVVGRPLGSVAVDVARHVRVELVALHALVRRRRELVVLLTVRSNRDVAMSELLGPVGVLVDEEETAAEGRRGVDCSQSGTRFDRSRSPPNHRPRLLGETRTPREAAHMDRHRLRRHGPPRTYGSKRHGGA